MNETFIINENRLFVPLYVGQTSGYAHIDTGAKHSSILQAYSEQFPNTGSRKRLGAFGTASISQVCLDEILFLGQTFHNMSADVQQDSIGGLDTLPFTVIMSLGCDVLLQKPLYLNFERSEIGFLEDSVSETKALVRLDADFSLGLPMFKVSLGDYTLDTGFDTGAALCVLNQRLLSNLQGDLIEDEPLEVDDVTGAKHTIPTYRCNRLTIGEHSLGECQFLVIDVSAIEQEAGRRIDFVFGVNAMMERSWVVNSQRAFIEML